jgi:ABC-type sulfate/molybdate transport systems ATPase subunit
VLAARGLVVERRSRQSRFELRVPALELVSGEVLAVLGGNGAGKTTLLRALAGLERPAAGAIETTAPGAVTMVFQRPIAFSGTVGHNVRVALRAAGVPREERAERGREALQRFGIAGLAERNSARLSGGELRRLALARALALRPAVLLLDEPFDDLDAAAREALSLDLRRAIDQTGVAVAVVTHDVRRASLIADRIAVLDRGRLLQVDSVERVLRAPESLEAARLVGMSNLLPGIVRSGRVAVDDEHAIGLEPAPAEGARGFAGIRPEHVKLDVGRGELTPIGKGRVRQVVSDGVVTRVVLDWAGHELRTHLVSGRGLARTLAPGDVLVVSIRPSHVHWIPQGGLE